ncbi:MAG: aminodeoxychorismate lyase [Vibrio sp.]
MTQLPQFWLNGQLTHDVGVTSRALHFGDGCFTTACVADGKLIDHDLHIARLKHSIAALGLMDLDWGLFDTWLCRAIESLDPKVLAGMKIMLIRGAGGRGYAPSLDAPTQVLIQTFAYPAHYSQWQEKGIRLTRCEFRLGDNPHLAGLKHNNRLEQVLIKQELHHINQNLKQNDPFDEVLVENIHQHVIEASSANVFWVHHNQVYTPQLTASGVSGIARQRVLAYLADQTIPTHISDFPLSAVYPADEIFITNALHGVVPVIQLNDQRFDIGPMTRLLQESLNRV